MSEIEIDYPLVWDADVLHKPYEIIDNPILNRQNLFESNVRSYPRRIPIVPNKAKGIYIKDISGKVFIDCLAGAGTMALGHNHEYIKEAMISLINSDHPIHCLDLATEIKDQFVTDVFNILPENFKRTATIQFCSPSGADAIEAALKLAKIVTGRSNILSFHGGFHGMTHGALSITGNLSPKKGISNLMSGVMQLPYPYHYRCPFGIGGHEAEEISLHYIDNILSDPESGITLPAAIILEIVQGEGGVISASKFWLQGIRKIATKYNILLIIDEVQTGIGRTGKMFAFEHAQISPDILVLSKAIGGGLPLAVLLFDKKIDKWASGAHTGTFRGNQLAMKAGSATLEFILKEDILSHVRNVSEYFNERLIYLKSLFPVIGDVRGKGLMLGLEIVNIADDPNNLGSYPGNKELSRIIQQECLKRGLIVELGGRNSSVIRFLPPLIITKDQIDDVLNILHDSIKVSISKK